MSKIVFTVHAKGKFDFFKKHSVIIKRKQVVDTIREGIIIDRSEFPIIQKLLPLDEDHSLIVVYRQEDKNIIIITFWIAEKGRYESKIQ